MAVVLLACRFSVCVCVCGGGGLFRRSCQRLDHAPCRLDWHPLARWPSQNFCQPAGRWAPVPQCRGMGTRVRWVRQQAWGRPLTVGPELWLGLRKALPRPGPVPLPPTPMRRGQVIPGHRKDLD